jgi:hypothetical protein
VKVVVAPWATLREAGLMVPLAPAVAVTVWLVWVKVALTAQAAVTAPVV